MEALIFPLKLLQTPRLVDLQPAAVQTIPPLDHCLADSPWLSRPHPPAASRSPALHQPSGIRPTTYGW
jgi:hypothetical protein